MNGGIDQLVDTYKGNPQPLAQKVQQAQQGQPPGAIPSDLEAALALQQIAELRQGAQNQQAIQAGGAQPSVVEKLQQMLGGMQQQAQMPQMPEGQPVMAASGGSIAHLVSNLGRHYAGGGIVAFNGEDDSDVKDEDVKKKLQQYTLQQQGADWVARKQAARLAEAGGQNKESLPQFIQDIAKVPEMFDAWKQRAREQDAISAAADRRMAQYKQDKLAAQQKTSLANYLVGSPEREKEGLEKLAELSNAPLPKTSVGDLPAPTDPEVEKLRRLAAARSQTGQNANPALVPRKPVVGTSPDDVRQRPSAPRPSAGESVAPAAALDPNSLRGLIEANIRKELGKDEDAEWRKGSKRYEDFMGLDKLLQPREARIAERQEMLKKIQGERTPAWVEALVAAGRPVRGGLGTLLSQMGGAAESTRRGYSAEDLKFFDEIGAMQDEVAKLKLDGKYKAAAAGESAIKDAIANKRQAEQSGTSLVATDERTETSKQIAKDNAAARVAAAAARGAGSGAGDRQQLNELKALQSSLKDQLKEPRMMGKAGDELRRQLGIVNAEIAKMAGLSTMATAPGAASPGGTSKPGWGIKPI